MLAVPADLLGAMGVLVDGHNSILDILYDTGIIGLAIYLGLALALFRELRVKASDKDEISIFATIWWCYIVAYFMSTEMFNGFVYAVGARWYSLVISGAVLALLARSGAGRTVTP